MFARPIAPVPLGPTARRDIHCRSTEQPTLSMRFRAPHAGVAMRLSEVCAALAEWLIAREIAAVGPPFVAYHYVAADEVEVEVGLSVEAVLTHSGALRGSTIPMGRYVTAMRQLDEGSLTEAAEFIEHWLAEHHESALGPLYVHLVSPAAVDTPTVVMVQRKVTAARAESLRPIVTDAHSALLLGHALAALEALAAHPSVSLA